MRDLYLRSSRETDISKRITCAIFAAIMGFSACACDSTTDVISESENPSAPAAIQVIDINGDVHETSVDVIEESEAEDNGSNRLPSRNLAMVEANMAVFDGSNYAYSELGESARNCYCEILAILEDHLEKVELSSNDPDEIDLAFRAVMVDHPEIFYVKGYSIGKYMHGDSLRKIVFSGTYTYDTDEIAQKNQKIEDYVNSVIASCPEGGSDYDRIRYVYEYLIRNNEYTTESENNQNILSVVENGRTVCQGYTKMMQLILNRMGIFCTLVNGKACGRNGVPDQRELADARNAEWGGHVWNIVKCDGLFYNVDVTWGDAAITLMDTDGNVSDGIDVNYEFFLVDDVSLLDTHEPDPVVQMPHCNSMEDNYYRHEGLYFTDIDPEQFARAFESALSEGERYLFLKADSPEVFEKMKEHLFEGQHIFEYLGTTNVRYVEFVERNLIMISL